MSDHKNFISVSDLAKKIGKSESTIKRLAVKLRNIEPLAIKVLGKKIYINTDYLHLVVGITDQPTSETNRPLTDNERPTSDQLTESMQKTIDILERELAAKNELINRLTATIDKMAVIGDFHNKVLNNVSLQIEPPKIKKLTWLQRLFKRVD
jgi:ParB-like chromosome segregation protein Spo0J